MNKEIGPFWVTYKITVDSVVECDTGRAIYSSSLGNKEVIINDDELDIIKESLKDVIEFNEIEEEAEEFINDIFKRGQKWI